MAGSKMGSLKKKLGLKGATKPGEMISRMNKMKTDSYLLDSAFTKGITGATVKFPRNPESFSRSETKQWDKQYGKPSNGLGVGYKRAPKKKVKSPKK